MTKKERKEKGLCTSCGKLPEIGKTKCIECLDKDNIQKKKYKERMLKEGRCTCGRYIDKGEYRCDVCKERDRLKKIKVRKRRKESNKCIKCGRPLIERNDVTKCVNCMESKFSW